MAKSGITVEGGDRLMKKLDRLAKREATAANRRAVARAITPVLRAAKNECPIEEGDLKRSLARKVYNRGTTANALVGVDRNYIQQDGERITRDEIVEGGVRKIPAKYDHLVEYGHIAPDGTAVPADPFIARAGQDSLPGAQAMYREILGDAIDKALAK